MNKYRTLTALVLLSVTACKKDDKTTLKSIIHTNVACQWFPLSEQSYYLYSSGDGRAAEPAKAHMSIRSHNQQIRIGNVTLSHNNCDMLTISYKDLKDAPLLSRTMKDATYWYGNTINNTTYTTYQTAYIKEFKSGNKTLEGRIAKLEVRKPDGTEQTITVSLIEGVGIGSVVISKNNSSDGSMHTLAL